MQLKWIHIVLLINVGVLLSSCYCFKNTYTASPVDLKSRSTPVSAMTCCENLNSKSFTITAYYAFINRDLFDQNLPSF